MTEEYKVRHTSVETIEELKDLEILNMSKAELATLFGR